ncbi:hypothetical protein myaer87_09350 [Microcystis aeruginosa NIES-87]|nr:hypothetical protein myaer87_09350 [Microcystis aeruginosa NIES-87]
MRLKKEKGLFFLLMPLTLSWELFSVFFWCFERLFVKSPSGRKRFNVLGALNAITHEVILVTYDTYITASQVCEIIEKIAALGLIFPITLVLDNARYQKCKIVE